MQVHRTVNQLRRDRSGFTLVEVLMVVAIIGILVGLIVPAVSMALTGVKKRAIAMECQTLANAIEQYKSKYGDYPPDGSNSALLQRHLRKIFPQILQSEIDILIAGSNASTTGGVMDPSEALVFFLGGFSTSPTNPFTGPGGPFAPTPSGSKAPYQYNIDRQNGFYEFKQSQLSIGIQSDPNSSADITVSVDETDYGLTAPTDFMGDLIPVYRPAGKQSPYVYFDSRTYASAAAIHSYTIPTGTVAPFLSATVNTKASQTPATIANRTNYYRFMNDKSFQLICAGLDDAFGANISGTALYVYRPSGEEPSKPDEPKCGQAFDILGTIPTGSKFPPMLSVSGFRSSTGDASLLDNCANFADGTLEESLSN